MVPSRGPKGSKTIADLPRFTGLKADADLDVLRGHGQAQDSKSDVGLFMHGNYDTTRRAEYGALPGCDINIVQYSLTTTQPRSKDGAGLGLRTHVMGLR